jgi:hypothetical protein
MHQAAQNSNSQVVKGFFSGNKACSAGALLQLTECIHFDKTY